MLYQLLEPEDVDVLDEGDAELFADEEPQDYRMAGRACSRCGCSDDRPCDGGCWWIQEDPPLCSQCAIAGVLGA